ncbi:uncharacterized protein LOC124806621 isoform X1 [Hydra vulgaris]|uniref:uncharacterized protein LOC124806621 isoform X1 n=1 Tax=Hydra vulgaris TaxID=6087 RepID=UPI001F5EBEC2|nr:uncharacterized protein LOC124806621 [Hydra vulgaris]
MVQREVIVLIAIYVIIGDVLSKSNVNIKRGPSVLVEKFSLCQGSNYADIYERCNPDHYIAVCRYLDGRNKPKVAKCLYAKSLKAFECPPEIELKSDIKCCDFDCDDIFFKKKIKGNK